MESLWKKQLKRALPKNGMSRAAQVLDKHWDVIVIGAGLAGLLSAYYLQEAGKKVLVLEAKGIASGQTEGTTAKITSQHGLKYSQLIKSVGAKKARMYARANEDAIGEYERLIEEKGISCEFERGPAYLYTVEKTSQLQKEAAAAKFLGVDAFFTKETELPFSVTGAVCFRNQAQFSPLEFVRYLADNLEILEHTPVLRIRGNRVFTKEGVLTGDKIVVATHYPFRNLPGFYFLRQHQERSYVLALSGCDRLNGMYYGVDQDGLSFRQAGEFLLLGGGSHRTGQKGCGGAYDKLRQAAKRFYPAAKEVARWSAQDCMPHDGIPFIGKYSVFTPNLYVATGFQKWGMTTSMVAAMILREELQGRKHPYGKVFCPQRMNFRAAIGNFLVDVGESVKGLSKGFFGKRSRRCPHLGCQLVWNFNERSWDCPCHGSRFDEAGKLIDNPAQMDVGRK